MSLSFSVVASRDGRYHLHVRTDSPGRPNDPCLWATGLDRELTLAAQQAQEVTISSMAVNTDAMCTFPHTSTGVMACLLEGANCQTPGCPALICRTFAAGYTFVP
jgi:hypothetical protein